MSELSKGGGDKAAATTPPAARRPVPPRDPAGEAIWRVTARHSPLAAAKSLEVVAKGADAAWRAYLDAAAAAQTERLYRTTPGGYQRAMDWINAARAVRPEGVEIIGAEYSEARKAALRVKGTVTVDQIGFAELASA